MARRGRATGLHARVAAGARQLVPVRMGVAAGVQARSSAASLLRCDPSGRCARRTLDVEQSLASRTTRAGSQGAPSRLRSPSIGTTRGEATGATSSFSTAATCAFPWRSNRSSRRATCICTVASVMRRLFASGAPFGPERSRGTRVPGRNTRGCSSLLSECGPLREGRCLLGELRVNAIGVTSIAVSRFLNVAAMAFASTAPSKANYLASSHTS